MTQTIARATEAQVRAIPEPAGTRSWNPVSHGRVLDAVLRVAEEKKVNIINSNYTLTGNGEKFFGALTIANGDKMNYMIGLRNAINMRFAAGFCSGAIITVCSNMEFSGEFMNFHRHTKSLTDDLMTEMALDTWDGVWKQQSEITERHNRMKEININETEIQALSFRAMQQGIFGPGKFNAFNTCLQEETKIAENLSIHTFHSSVTRLVRDESLFQIANTTPRLNEFCETEMFLAA